MNRHRKLISFARLGLWKSWNKMVGLSSLALAAARSLTSLGVLSIATVALYPNITGVIKYRVELCLDDGAANATFVVFNREMVNLTKQDAAGLTLDEMNGAGLKDSRNVLKALLEKNLFFFQICVTPFNVSPSHRTFTVSAIIESIVPETFETEKTEFVQVEGGVASAPRGRRLKVKTLNQVHPLL
ncbi:uncharacterized protein LOC108832092 isoform X1 [Raphanus sativus]|uniref:Uncharacterized protein LOC108832092 isoform X1 n=1 Tax=Raphanus sativus TaxID=3726 RepID=A0A6J0LP22_RAPSA|nr:uncharacterized protein LOC108832092 isoform X1 [Raphanus sativus]